MKKNEKSIEQLTSKYVKSLGQDEPSADFTLKVMQSIAFGTQPEFVEQQKNYWWLLIFVPILTAITWYSIVALKLTDYRLLPLEYNMKPFIAPFIELFSKLKGITLSPFLMVSFIAILSLLLIEDLTKRLKHSA
jgi:hypothetical protein